MSKEQELRIKELEKSIEDIYFTLSGGIYFKISQSPEDFIKYIKERFTESDILEDEMEELRGEICDLESQLDEAFYIERDLEDAEMEIERLKNENENLEETNEELKEKILNLKEKIKELENEKSK